MIRKELSKSGSALTAVRSEEYLMSKFTSRKCFKNSNLFSDQTNRSTK